ncbi:MAG TPA: S-methyl-5'-thioinosine phosphorylase [Burkholderiales bacterium]|jgi:5'-methylthioadenosine phosphorylase|nr:S-methyl-5'-thioinosine phosphorylase [Burkholderiales bacterium]
MLAIIGGTGLTQLANLESTRRRIVRTPYGEGSGPLTFGKLAGRDVIFLARHGYGHTIPPHAVNYRANVWALKAEGAGRIVSVASVGGIRSDMVPGTLAVPSQILDYTHGRKHTFFEGPDQPVTHIDFTHPYCDVLRGRLLEAARRAKQPVVDGGVYATTQGPRLETAAEIDRLERDGADMVGMTGMPEAALAREIGLRYAAVAVIVNYAAGRADSAKGIHLEQINAVLQSSMARVRALLVELVAQDD